MPPNERRIIHVALREDDTVSTESVGAGDRRRVHGPEAARPLRVPAGAGLLLPATKAVASQQTTLFLRHLFRNRKSAPSTHAFSGTGAEGGIPG